MHSFFIFFLIALPGLYLGAQKRYDGSLSETDRRIKDIRQEILEKDFLDPLLQKAHKIRLRYSGKRNDHLAFYDREGQVAYFRYRQDRFDDLAEKNLPALRKGQAYEVHGLLSGLLISEKFIAKDAPEFKNSFRNVNTRLVFQFHRADSLFIEKLF